MLHIIYTLESIAKAMNATYLTTPTSYFKKEKKGEGGQLFALAPK
jgi:hypothetical protein